MTNVFAAEPACSFHIMKDIKDDYQFVLEKVKGDTPEAVMAQAKPFYKKYNEFTSDNFYSYKSHSINYTFIGFNSIYSDERYSFYDVKKQNEYCFYDEDLTLSTPPELDCRSYEAIDQIICTVPICSAPANGQRAAADCTQTVSLTPAPGQTEPRPKGSEGGDGKSTYDLIAKVTEGNKPKAGMALTFTAEVEAGSGNHPLNPPDRPKGELSVKSGTTNASGEVKVTFTSPIFAGTHKVKVECAKCTGTVKEAESKFNVKVPNLTKTPANINWRFISTDNYHKNNNTSTATQTVYYLTQPAHTSLVELTTYMVNNGWKDKDPNNPKNQFSSVGLNDASLEWGGKFYSYPSEKVPGSAYPDWKGAKSHFEHHIGTYIDLRTNRLVDSKIEEQMYKKICPKDGTYPVQAKILWHTGKAKNAAGKSIVMQHYHAYLLGNFGSKEKNSKLGGGECRITHT